MSGTLPPGLHIVGGDSAAGCFKQAFASVDRLLIHADYLSCGPIPEWERIEQWKAARLAYLKQWSPEGWDDHPGVARFDLLSNLDRLRDAGPIHVWAGTGVEEQWLIAWIVELVRRVGADMADIRVVQFEHVPGTSHTVLGMGMLRPEQMRVYPEPAALGEAGLAQCRAAWAALASGTPALLAEFSASHAGPNAWLTGAVEHIVRRYPERSSGLNDWETRLLANVAKRGPTVARVIGYTMVGDDLDASDHVSDGYLFWRLCRMADGHCPQPLVRMTGARTSLRGTEVTLSPFGEAVLEGRASSYPANPIHDQIGGVELSSASGALWFSEGDRLVRG